MSSVLAFEMETILHENQELLHSFFEEAPIGIFSCDTNATIVNCNEELSKVSEWFRAKTYFHNVNKTSCVIISHNKIEKKD